MADESIKVSIAVPTAGTVPMSFAFSLSALVGYTAANRVPSMPGAEAELQINVVESSNWITNREQLARHAIDEGYTHLLFLDDDMTFHPSILSTLLGRRQPIVVTNYLIKTDAPEFVAVDLAGNRIPTTEQSTGLQPIAYSGFGASLFEVEVFKRTAQPWFLPDFDAAQSSYTTEDNPFFRRAREAGFKVLLDHDASKLLGHVGRRAWRWQEWRPSAQVLPMNKGVVNG